MLLTNTITGGPLPLPLLLLLLLHDTCSDSICLLPPSLVDDSLLVLSGLWVSLLLVDWLLLLLVVLLLQLGLSGWL